VRLPERGALGVVELLELGRRMIRLVFPIRRNLLSAMAGILPRNYIIPSGSSGGTVD
jgi:hypothetical protein